MPPEMYSEEEVNRLLGEQAIKLRLDGVEQAVRDLTKHMEDHSREEDYNQELILSKISEGANDRRRGQTQVEETIAKNHEHYHRIFVKKDDLRTYAAIIIFAVTTTTGFITWLGARHQDDAMITEVKKMIQEVRK